MEDQEAATRRVPWKKVLLEISENSQEISKNTFFTEHLWATASEKGSQWPLNQGKWLNSP